MVESLTQELEQAEAEHSRARQESVALRLVLEAALEEAAAHGLDLYSWVESHWNSVAAAVSQPSSATLREEEAKEEYPDQETEEDDEEKDLDEPWGAANAVDERPNIWSDVDHADYDQAAFSHSLPPPLLNAAAVDDGEETEAIRVRFHIYNR